MKHGGTKKESVKGFTMDTGYPIDMSEYKGPKEAMGNDLPMAASGDAGGYPAGSDAPNRKRGEMGGKKD